MYSIIRSFEPPVRRAAFLQSASFRRVFHGKTARVENPAKNDTSGKPGPDLSRRGILHWYTEMLDAYPLLTKCVTSGLVAGSGDVICQVIMHVRGDSTGRRNDRPDGAIERTDVSFSPDVARTGRFVFLGSCLVAPYLHLWYGFVMTRVTGSVLVATVKRTALDQLVCAPPFLVVFVSAIMTLEGRSLNDIYAKLKADYVDMLIANYILWIPAQGVNFGLIPMKFQVGFSNVVAVAWNIYLSYKTCGGVEKFERIENGEADPVIALKECGEGKS